MGDGLQLSIELFIIIFSIWFLTFYCNPRTKMAVVGKILMEGIGATGALYGQYIEKYLHNPVEEIEYISEMDIDHQEEKSSFDYDVGNIRNVFYMQFLYLLLIPFKGLSEIWSIVKDIFGRDFSRKFK